MRSPAQPLAQRLCHGNATAHYYDVNILGRALQEDVANIAAHHITLQPQLVSRSGNLLENVVLKVLFQFVCCKFQHILSHFLY